MSWDADLAVLARAAADAAAVRRGDVVLLLGDEDTGPAAVAVAAELARRGAVVRPWLHLAAVGAGDDSLLADLATRCAAVVALNVAPPAASVRRVRVSVPTHLGAQDAGRSLPAHAAALAARPEIAVLEAEGG